jgi:hypothetical protein
MPFSKVNFPIYTAIFTAVQKIGPSATAISDDDDHCPGKTRCRHLSHPSTGPDFILNISQLHRQLTFRIAVNFGSVSEKVIQLVQYHFIIRFSLPGKAKGFPVRLQQWTVLDFCRQAVREMKLLLRMGQPSHSH